MITADRRILIGLKTLRLLGGLGVAFVLSGCGADSNPAPTPTPVTSQAFLHLLDTQAGTLSSFEVLASTGHLESRGSDFATSSNSLATDPLGRYVYVGGADSAGVFVSTYSLDAGTPVHRHKLTLGASRIPPEGVATYGDQVFASFKTHSGYQGRGILSSLRVDEATSRLIVADEKRERDPREGLTTDQGWRVAYWHVWDWTSAYQTSADGVLRVVATTEESSDYGGTGCKPSSRAVATRGLIFAPDTCGGLMTLELSGDVIKYTHRTKDAFVPGSGSLALALSSTGLLAVAADAVRIYSFTDTGELTLKSQAFEQYSSLAFHPAGDFLYASGHGRLKTFRVGSDGQLSDFDDIYQPTSLVAVTPPRNR